LSALKEVSYTLEQSEGESTVLKASLTRIQNYSQELNGYCSKLEQENQRLTRNNTRLKIGWGITGGTSGVLVVILLLILL
jgi:DNA repair ATPase RecN